MYVHDAMITHRHGVCLSSSMLFMEAIVGIKTWSS